jgi:hypothetical protein
LAAAQCPSVTNEELCFRHPLVVRVFHDARLSPPLSVGIPGTVKLWESPRQSRRVSRWTKFQIAKLVPSNGSSIKNCGAWGL